MKYDSLSRNTVKITLTEADMREYSLCAENIAMHTAESKRSLSRLLKKMKLFAGYRPDRLFLEAFPKTDGGCILYVSSLFEEETGECRTEGAVMCCLDSLSELIQLCHTVEKYELQIQTCVYRSRRGYLLVAIAESADFCIINRIFAEFGRVCTDLSEIYTVSEYASSVCPNDASRYFAQLY